MNTFKFNKNTTILIYGYGKVGRDLYNKLIKNGYKVAGFVDKNANKSDINNDFVLISPEGLNAEFMEHIIVLAFQNMLEQERVAKILYDKGANKIIYLSRSNDAMYKRCFEAYNSLVYGQSITDFEFPYTKIHSDNTKPLYYCQTDELVVTEVPSTIIFSAAIEEKAQPDVFNEQLLEERNISALYEYNAVCELALKGEADHIEDFHRYCDITCGTERTIEYFLEDRVQLFDMLLEEYKQKGIAFFRSSPSSAKWNSKGYFNLVDGHHRAAFLTNIFNYDIPIRITKEDYDKWCNWECAQGCKKYMEKHHIHKTYTPIINPVFFSIDSVTENRGRRTSSALYRFFSREGVVGYRVLDIYSNLSYYAQHFARMGAGEIVSVEKRDLLFQLAIMLNSLHRTINIDMRNMDFLEIDERQRFDIVIMANDIQLSLNSEREASLYLGKIDRLSSRYFVWKSLANAEYEKEYILENSEFNNYHFLNTEFIEGKIVEVGVYEK